ncbi:EF-hand domain-containing family member B [Pontoporia blainvillei]|uniref:EF-hand domain-containing family member B n=1 Tax=Pontoporia blainvillei TaxID=48723 RepID=A0ABX0S1Z3_PONBL|nr:EF-hand domain-containing family member B [Pontoporia blainvillei]
MRVSERKSPMGMDVALTQEGKDDLGERRVFMGTVSPTELGLRVGLGKEDSPCSNKYEERMASLETKCPSSNGLDIRLKRQNISRTFMDGNNLGVSRVSASQETKCPLRMLPGRAGLENERFLAGCCPGSVTQSPLGLVCESPQALDSRRCPVVGDPEELGASVGKQPTLGMEPRQGLEKESTCVVMKPSTEMQPPVEVDMGFPQPEDPDEARPTKPQMGLVIEPSECQLAQQPEEQREAEDIEPGLEPPDRIRPIYSGKFFDRLPCWPSKRDSEENRVKIPFRNNFIDLVNQ